MSTIFSRYLFIFIIAGLLLSACNANRGGLEQSQTERTEQEQPVEPSEIPSQILSPNLTETPTQVPYTTPEWFDDAVVYEVFVRSFRDSNGDGTGDLKGVTESLDYIQSLGANTLWLMPVFPSPSQHGYDVEDFLGINPDYGNVEDLQDLVDQAHARDMRVILDFVPSHLSNQNPLFTEAYGNPDSELSDWFVWTNDDHTLYASFAGNEQMPRFNHFNPHVVDYLTEAALYWLDLDGDGDYQDGIDGFRVDNATFPPQEFITALRRGVKSANPDAILLGETWVHNPSDLSIYYLDQFDALFDFPFYETMQGNRDFNGDGILAGDSFPVLLSSLFKAEEEKFPPQAQAVRFLSNHDTNRNATELKGDADRLKLAAAILASLPGPIMLYYGEEIGMLGQKGGPPDYDNYRREPMDWYADQNGMGQTTWFRPDDRWNVHSDDISVEEQESDQESLLNFYRHVIALRNSQPALKEGDFQIIELEAAGIGPWGYVRTSGDQIILVLINFGTEELEVTLSDFPFSSGELLDLITGKSSPVPSLGENFNIELVPAEVVWLTDSQ